MKTTKDLMGEKVAQYRSALGWSQDQLADKSGVPRRTVQNIEYGEVSPRVDNLAKIAKALNVSLLDLLRPDHDDRNPSERRAQRVAPELKFVRDLLDHLEEMKPSRKQYVLALIFRDEGFLESADLRQAYRAISKSL